MGAERGEFEDKLDAILKRTLDGCRGLVSAERLSGGASQETYRLTIATDDGEIDLGSQRTRVRWTS